MFSFSIRVTLHEMMQKSRTTRSYAVTTHNTAIMENRVIAEFNAVFGSKVENLAKSKDLVNKYVDQLNAIEEKVRWTLIFRKLVC